MSRVCTVSKCLTGHRSVLVDRSEGSYLGPGGSITLLTTPYTQVQHLTSSGCHDVPYRVDTRTLDPPIPPLRPSEVLKRILRDLCTPTGN